ncbi:MAG TPA: hypothetical protein DGM69_05285 [Chloroflexi bacterium]|nr:hypothetical protein [Chloroflexota bacterium]
MKKYFFIIFLLSSSMLFCDPGDHTIQGSHTLTQQNDMGITEAIDLALRQALVNGLFNHLSTCDDYEDFTDEDISRFMDILSGAVEMCVTEPVIIEQSINGNTVFVKASGQVEPMILNAILGIEN